MALNNKRYDINSLIELTNTGIDAPLFPQIRDAITRRMMEIYGVDIDTSSASADGQYINMEALILNNMCRVIETIHKNINPSTATGNYLDALCSLANIYRIQPSYSTAQLYIKNITSSPLTPTKLTFVDKNNETWIWYNPIDFLKNPTITFEPDEVTTIQVTCYSKIGPVQALGTGVAYSDSVWTNLTRDSNGDIYQPTEFGSFQVYQSEDAVLGNNEETDVSLRHRKLSLVGNGSLTVLESVKSNLLNILGIKDVYIYNNVTGADVADVGDGTPVKSHDIYICVRYENNVNINAETVGTTIYKSITPGVLTTETSDSTYGEDGEYELTIVENLNTTIKWKICKPIKPEIEINFTLLNITDFTNEQKALIVSTLKDYLNEVKIGETISATSIQSLFLSCDLKPNGNSQFFPTGCTIDNDSLYKAPLTYLNYTDEDFVFNFNTTDGTLTIGGSQA